MVMKVRWLSGVPMIALIVAGCSSMPEPAPAKPEDQVSARAQARWDALLAGDYKKSYGFLSPGSKEIQSEEQYVARIKPGLWRGAKVKSVSCQAEAVCNVVVSVDYSYSTRDSSMNGTRGIDEKWIRQAGAWWWLPRR